MEPKRKISPAFEQYMAECGPNDKRDAIVIYRTSSTEEDRQKGRLSALSKRLDYVRARAAAQGPIQEKLMDNYRKASSRHMPKTRMRRELEITSIGANTLPVAAAQVTRKTLPALASQPEVIAILPNQRIHLIKPKEVNYEAAEQSRKQRRPDLGPQAPANPRCLEKDKE